MWLIHLGIALKEPHKVVGLPQALRADHRHEQPPALRSVWLRLPVVMVADGHPQRWQVWDTKTDSVELFRVCGALVPRALVIPMAGTLDKCLKMHKRNT